MAELEGMLKKVVELSENGKEAMLEDSSRISKAKLH